MMSQSKQLKVTLVRSIFGQLKMHRDCVHGLGLRRPYQTVEVTATPENLGMIRKSAFMLKVEEVA
jgi:large subunit ribosomal protein L30